MKYETIIQDFINKFPELQQESNEELAEIWHKEEQLPHVFFGNVLDQFLVRELNINKHKKLLKRIFEFLESMAASKDQEVIGVLKDTILEYVGDDKNILKRARSLMGQETLKLSHQAEKSLGRE